MTIRVPAESGLVTRIAVRGSPNASELQEILKANPNGLAFVVFGLN